MPWPEAATVAEETLEAQIEATARELPERPLVLGGCCCSHVGAVRELRAATAGSGSCGSTRTAT